MNWSIEFSIYLCPTHFFSLSVWSLLSTSCLPMFLFAHLFNQASFFMLTGADTGKQAFMYILNKGLLVLSSPSLIHQRSCFGSSIHKFPMDLIDTSECCIYTGERMHLACVKEQLASFFYVSVFSDSYGLRIMLVLCFS